MLFNKLADTWSWRNVSRGCASYRWPLSLTRARSTAIRLLVGNSADPEIVSTTPLAWPRCTESRGGRKERIWTRGGGRNLWAIAAKEYTWNWLPWFPTCHRLFPFATSAGITNSILAHLCLLRGVYHRLGSVSRAGRKQKQKSSQQGRLEFSSFADFPLAPQMQSRCSAKFLLSTFEFYAKFEISRLELKFIKY